jgi:3-oxoacyl-[acyl-carrier protein] reductase
MKPLHGKRALVTGASGALGSAIAARLAADGAHVLLHANSRPDTVQAQADALVAAGGSAEVVAFDITDDAAVRRPPRRCSKAARCRSSSTTPASTTTRCSPA